MKRWNGLTMAAVLIVLLIAALAPLSRAADVYPLMHEERTAWDANVMVEITHADLTETTDNTAQTLTSLTVAAKEGWELVAAVLVEAFTDDATNAYNDVTVTAGDGTDPDLYLSSMQLNSYGTEVYLQFGRSRYDNALLTAAVTAVTDQTATVATNGTVALSAQTGNFGTSLTLQSADLNGTNVITNVVLNVAAAWTNATAAFTAQTTTAVTNTTVTTGNVMSTGAGQIGSKLYTAADTIDFVFTPMAGYSLADLDNGKIRFYFRKFDALSD